MKYVVVIFAIFTSTLVNAQSTEQKPKLVVGIVVDQMRNEYLQRFEDKFGDDGFKKLMREGFYGANHHFSYMPTSTGPGHASIYTGTTPGVHGIVANNWYDRQKKKKIYCAEDRSVKTIGAMNDRGQMSPANLQVTTITDELKLFWNKRSKVIGVSIKDRGAVLPAGHLADGAYWLSENKFISSSFYFDELPQWVEDFNSQNLVEDYIREGWQPSLPISEYEASLTDENPYEVTWAGEDTPVLPKNLKKLARENGKRKVLTLTPFGNSFVTAFAKSAIESENLGSDGITDFLAMSYSSPDYIGHAYGPRAIELEDNYIKLDREIASLLNFLDQKVGEGNYTVFLTADHGVAEVGQFSLDENLPGGYINTEKGLAFLDSLLLSIHPLGMDLVEEIEGNQLFFDSEKLREADLELDDLSEEVAVSLNNLDHIYAAYPAFDVYMSGGAGEFPMNLIYRGLHPKLRGDVVWLIKSGYMDYGSVGSTHGSAWNYDTHVPLLMYGKNIQPGITYRETHIRDIAPTLSMICGIPLPSGCTGTPIPEVLNKQ